jgi:hypothetical protein
MFSILSRVEELKDHGLLQKHGANGMQKLVTINNLPFKLNQPSYEIPRGLVMVMHEASNNLNFLLCGELQNR